MDISMILLILGGFLGELLDSSLGMLYGTILSPVLIIAGYDPLVVVPCKVLLDLAGEPMLVCDMNRLSRAQTLDSVVVATTVNPSDSAIVNLCDET